MRIKPDDEVERAGVNVRDPHHIGRSNRVEVWQLIAARTPARLGRRTNPYIHKQTHAADFDENAARADLVRAVEKGDAP